MQNINFNNEPNIQSIKNKKEFYRCFSSSKSPSPALALKKLSNDFLLSQTKTLVQKERKINIEILQHLQEIESRKLYLERGFSSLFDYAIKELGYGEGAAYRRIKAMKLCQDIPETKIQIESGQLNLSKASQLQSFFEKQQRKSKMKLKNKSIHTTAPNNTKSFSRTSVQQILRNVSSLRRNSALSKENCDLNLCFSKEKSLLKNPENVNYDSKEIVQNKSFESLNQKKNLIEKTLGKSQAKTQKLLSEIDPEIFQKKEKAHFIGNQKVELKVILDEDCFKNLKNLKNLLSHKNPRMSYGELISLLAELGLKKYDPRKKVNQKPKKKQENQKSLKDITLNSPLMNNAQFNKKLKRKYKEECSNANFDFFNNKEDQNSGYLFANDVELQKEMTKKSEEKSKTQDEKHFNSHKDFNKPKVKNKKMEYIMKNKSKKNNRFIPQKIKRYIWKRDQGKCSYTCPQTRNKCCSKYLLQIDHIQPFALGGSHHPDNLRLLCARHNQYRSQRTFGFKS